MPAIKWKKPFNRKDFAPVKVNHHFLASFRGREPGASPKIKVEGLELGDRMKKKATKAVKEVPKEAPKDEKKEA